MRVRVACVLLLHVCVCAAGASTFVGSTRSVLTLNPKLTQTQPGPQLFLVLQDRQDRDGRALAQGARQ